MGYKRNDDGDGADYPVNIEYYSKYNWFMINNYYNIIIYNNINEKSNKFLSVWNERHLYIGYEGKYFIR